MNEIKAIKFMSALAQEHRLRIFRLLMQEGANGLAASAIAEAVQISRTSVSFHLKELETSGLLHSWREGRSIRYAVVIEAVRGFLVFLTQDCCQGHPEICSPLMAPAQGFCCVAKEKENV